MNAINPTSRSMQKIAWFFIILMITEICFPATALALTSGPTQPEAKSFEPVGTTEMVNVFSGDFTYNVPLFEVPGPDGGYPINLFYNSVTNADEEATWTGLGWNINIGSLSRSMRGMPDDFSGEKVSRRLDMKPKIEATVGVDLGLEFGGNEEIANKAQKLAGSISLGFNYIWNSYKGAGLSLALGGSIGAGQKASGRFKPNLNMGITLSGLESASVNAGFSLSVGAGGTEAKPKSAMGGFNAGISLNGRDGLTGLTLGYTLPKKNTENNKGKNSRSMGGTVSFAKPAYSPSVSIPWSGFNVSGRVAFTPGGALVYGKIGINGSYSQQWIEGAGQWKSSDAYGYNYLHMVDATENFLMDYNHEKDGSLGLYSRFLAIPSMTHDIYNVVGQGVGGTYRSHRPEFGWLHDRNTYSASGGFGISAEAGTWLELGLGASVNFTGQRTNPWALDPALKYGQEAGTEAFNVHYEPFYYKAAGDISSEATTAYDYMGGDEALRLDRDGYGYKKFLENAGGQSRINFSNGAASINNRGSRKGRNMSIQPITNKELLDNNNELLPQYDIKYYGLNSLNNYQGTAPQEDLVRTENNQNAGFTVLGQNGVRWVYGLPVMNNKHREVLFSVDNSQQSSCAKEIAILTANNTPAGNADEQSAVFYKAENSNQYLDEKDISAYTHTHLLTSVVGADYADVDGQAGPSDGDVGYWMKTNYIKLEDDYQWRGPYSGANYIKGQENSIVDDLGTFSWGSREVYLPASIETKTHIAYFRVGKRFDARGAENYITNASSPSNGAYSYKLDQIELFSKREIEANGAQAVPLKTIHFEYDYSLCKGVDNNNPTDAAALADNPNVTITDGKLTLKKVWFTYENSNRGALSPYEFDYEGAGGSNYSYASKNVDRWGAFKAGTDTCDLITNPYTKQFKKNTSGLNDNEIMKEELDRDISNWHIKTIKTPSGAVINLEMERDDYAYVQDKVATQIMPIDELQNDNKDVFFELEQPLSTSLTATEIQEALDKYTEDLPIVSDPLDNTPDRKQVYLKTYVNLRNATAPTYEYVPVYATLSKDANNKDIYIDQNSIQGGFYTKAYVRLNQAQMKTITDDPISVFSWQYLRDNLPNKIFEVDLGSETGDFSGMMAAGPSLESLFTGYFRYARDKGFGGDVMTEKSFIKLNSPDKVKYGGNIRVKSVRLDDQWAQNTATSTLGVVYDYTTTDENNEIISSGVLQNEPTIGYDACALRFAEVYYERLSPNVVDDIHVFELPMNESYYPSASVGYSRVTVRSLASDYAKQKAEGQTIPNDLPDEFATTGQTVNEFYTAKDFPIITTSTPLDRIAVLPWVNTLSSFIGFSSDTYAGTQGYSIELNDMHGKPKEVITYAQKKDGSIAGKPLTRVEYKYKEKSFTKDGKILKRLHNEVKVLLEDLADGSSTNAMTEDRLVGVEQEFFLDSRQTVATSISVGLDFNADIVGWWPAILPWPTPNLSLNDTRTSVTNKVIMRYGILEETHAYDGESHIVTTNKVFNAQTGAPVLTTVDNQLAGKIYNYTIPADLAHEGMGAAAKNWGRLLKGTLEPITCTGYNEFTSGSGLNLDRLVPGDEYILFKENTSDPSNITIDKARVVYMGWLLNDANTYGHQFDVINLPISSGDYVEMKNIRSGYRNLVNASIAQYSTVDTDGANGNPLGDRGTASCEADFVEFLPPNGTTIGINTVNEPTLNYNTINNVLSAAANAYDDEWVIEHSDYCQNLPDNPYLRGEKGVWRSKSTYAYIQDRNMVELANGDVDIKKSGTVDGVPLFNWKSPYFEFCVNDWVRTEDVTKYNLEGAAIEARDVIGNYQAEIYGRDDNLVVAKGINTRYYEMGFESFEDPNIVGSLQQVADAGNFNSGNLNFLPKPTSCKQGKINHQENYRLSFPMKEPNGGKGYVLIRKTFDVTNALPNNIMLNFYDGDKKEEITLDQSYIKQYGLNLNTGQRVKIPGLGIMLDEDSQLEFTVYELDFVGAQCGVNLNRKPATDWWAGDATLTFEENLSGTLPQANSPQIGYTDYDAHTGQYSLKIHPVATDELPNNTVVFPQNKLRLERGKRYVISLWLSRENSQGGDNVYTYKDDFDDGLMKMTMGGVSLEPSGPLIEGWQRVEGEFVYDGTNNNLEIAFPAVNGGANYDGFEFFLFDDVRIFPAKANMQSYVYDPIDYKLRAILDNNNYATFYVYNRAGDLILLKRETERGVKTIQESRNFIKPSN